MSRCILCDRVDAAVVQVATCTDHCTVTAHPACFSRRQATSLWRKKHSHRPNTESELCLVRGCQGKCKVKGAAAAVHADADADADYGTKGVAATRCDVFRTLDDPAHPCCFMGRDGFPCRRPAVANNACARHAGDAALMHKMIVAQDAGEVKTVDGALTDAATQTAANDSHTLSRTVRTLERTKADLERTAAELERTKAELARTTAELERTTAERVVLRVEATSSVTRAERFEIDVRDLRAENVTLKRREEFFKGAALSAVQRERRETVRKVQQLLETLQRGTMEGTIHGA